MMPDDYRGEWQTRELADAFLEGLRGAIPGADLQLAVLGKIAAKWCPNARRLLDLGCGNGILGAFLLGKFPAAHCLLMDFSDPMLEAAGRNVGSEKNVTIAKGDFGSPAWRAVASPHGPFDVVVSGFAIHHQPDNRKRALYGEILDVLAQGGYF